MITINSIGATTINDISSIYQQLLDNEDDTIITIAFPDDDLTVEITFNDEAHTLTSTIRETGEITEWSDIRLCGELFHAVSEFVSNLWCHEWFA